MSFPELKKGEPPAQEVSGTMGLEKQLRLPR